MIKFIFPTYSVKKPTANAQTHYLGFGKKTYNIKQKMINFQVFTPYTLPYHSFKIKIHPFLISELQISKK